MRKKRDQEAWKTFCSLTEMWMGVDRPAPGGSFKSLTAAQKREACLFYNHHKNDMVKERFIKKRIAEKYFLTPHQTWAIIKQGDKQGINFEKRQSGRVSLLRSNPDLVREVVAHCRANPLTFSVKSLAAKYHANKKTMSRILKENGIKIYTAQEKRALKLNMSGKPYEPYYATPEVAAYRNTAKKFTKLRRQQGDTTDGRREVKKNPEVWKELRQKVGVPDGAVLYNKDASKKDYQRQSQRRKELKAAEQVTSPPKKRVRPSKKSDQNVDNQLAAIESIATGNDTTRRSPKPSTSREVAIRYDEQTGELVNANSEQIAAVTTLLNL